MNFTLFKYLFPAFEDEKVEKKVCGLKKKCIFVR